MASDLEGLRLQIILHCVLLGQYSENGFRSGRVKIIIKARDDVIAVTYTGLGRFALPVLIGHKATHKGVDVDGWEDKRLLELTRQDFQNLEVMGQRIDEYVRQSRQRGD